MDFVKVNTLLIYLFEIGVRALPIDLKSLLNMNLQGFKIKKSRKKLIK